MSTTIPPLFHCYEKYSAVYGRSTLGCTNCPDANFCHAKLTRVKSDIYSIGQCEHCRFDMVARVHSRLACSLQLVHVRMLEDGTAVRVNREGIDVYPDGTIPRTLRPIINVIEYVPGQPWGLPNNDSVAGFPMSPRPLSLVKPVPPPSPIPIPRARIPSPRDVLSKLFKSSIGFSFKSQKPHPKAHPKHPKPILVRVRSHTRSASKTAAIGTAAAEKKAVRWNNH